MTHGPRTYRVTPAAADAWLCGQRPPGPGFVAVRHCNIALYVVRVVMVMALFIGFLTWAVTEITQHRWCPWGGADEVVMVWGKGR